MAKLCTKLEISICSHPGNKKGETKFTKWGAFEQEPLKVIGNATI